jgi:hypothetical protein
VDDVVFTRGVDSLCGSMVCGLDLCSDWCQHQGLWEEREYNVVEEDTPHWTGARWAYCVRLLERIGGSRREC